MRIKKYDRIEKDSQAYSRILDAYGEPADIENISGSVTLITYFIEEGVIFQFFKSNDSIISPRLMGEGEKLKNAEANLSKKTGLELIIKSEKSV